MILEDCKLIAELCDAGVPQMADMVIDRSKATVIVPCRASIEGEHERVDIHGTVLLLGLIDTHMHLFMGRVTASDRDRITMPAQWVFDCYNYARSPLDNDHTIIRDVGDEPHYSGLAMRNAINKGVMQGPRVYGSGVTIAPVMIEFGTYEYFCDLYSTKEDVRRMTKDQFNYGAGFLKLYGTDSMLMGDNLPGKRIMLEDKIAEAVTMVKSKGSYCTCHCYEAETIDVMIEQRVRTIEHANFVTDRSCKKLDGRESVGITPTIACSYLEALGITEGVGAAYGKFSHVSAEWDARIRNVYENYDVLTGWGTDTDLGSVQANPCMKQQARKSHPGVSNLDLLKQAAINNAILMEVDNRIGTVPVGELADFVVVDGNPIADITAMHKKPVRVIRDDKVI